MGRKAFGMGLGTIAARCRTSRRWPSKSIDADSVRGQGRAGRSSGEHATSPKPPLPKGTRLGRQALVIGPVGAATGGCNANARPALAADDVAVLDDPMAGGAVPSVPELT